MTRYFELEDDMRIKGRWHLSAPVGTSGGEIDPWQFKKGRVLKLDGEPVFHLSRPGLPLDFSLAGFTIPLLCSQAASVFEKLGVHEEIQLIPARVEGQAQGYFILNPLKVIRCIDDARCEEVEVWGPEDGAPDRIGEYQNVVGLKIDTTRVAGANIFRPWGWTGVLIVSERVKLAMEEEDLVGPVFTEV
jgi:hypothetical protein